ncbi:MAG: glycosyltransferase family 4 protein [Longimicrobiales bacterium]
MTGPPLHVVVPGPLDQRTGGYLYDAYMVREMRRRGRTVEVHEVPGRFPATDAAARSALDAALGSVPDGRPVVVDGLALGGAPDAAAPHADRLRLVGLVHHPLADETGLEPARRADVEARERRALEAVRGVIVTSDSTGRRVGRMGVEADRIRVVRPGTAPATSPASPARDRAAGTPVHLLCVATLTPRKGQDLLVRALSGLRAGSGGVPWRCTLVGSDTRDPAFAASVRAAVRDGGLADRIEIAGEVDDAALEAAWAEADVFVLPSWFEGYGMALTEAMARGLPVVSTTGGAIPETVPADAAVLVEPGAVDPLRNALDRLVGDAALRRRMGAAGLRHAAGLPDWPTQSVLFEDAVDALGTLAPRGAGTSAAGGGPPA